MHVIYAAFTLWFFLILFVAIGVHRLWAGLVGARPVGWALLPGTLVAEMAYILGCLITGGEIRRANLFPTRGGPRGGGEAAEPRTEAEEMASQPWYTVGPNDIFPEEFRLFFSGNQRARKVFDKLHSDIYEASFWQGLQERISSGYVEDFFPYRREMRFDRSPAPAAESA